jgi:hypothetical protein
MCLYTGIAAPFAVWTLTFIVPWKQPAKMRPALAVAREQHARFSSLLVLVVRCNAAKSSREGDAFRTSKTSSRRTTEGPESSSATARASLPTMSSLGAIRAAGLWLKAAREWTSAATLISDSSFSA